MNPSHSKAEAAWSRPRQALALLLRGRTAHVALPVAAVVGTILSSVNQGAIILSGETTTATWLRVAINYMVPFCVSSYGYLSARRVRPGPSGSAGDSAPANGSAPSRTAAATRM